jgi:hypothetical protein
VFSFSLGVTGQSKQDPSQGFAWWIQGREGSARRNLLFFIVQVPKVSVLHNWGFRVGTEQPAARSLQLCLDCARRLVFAVRAEVPHEAIERGRCLCRTDSVSVRFDHARRSLTLALDQ